MENKVKLFLDKNNEWRHENDSLVRVFEFDDFRQAISFIVHFSFLSDQANHHAEITNTYNKVTIKLTTHDENESVSEKDVSIAEDCEVLFNRSYS